MNNLFSVYLLCILMFGSSVNTLRVTGSWHSKHFFKFIAKFGFQQTNLDDKSNTQGYIYGNVTTRDNITSTLTLVVVDSEYFLQYYGNYTTKPKSKACSSMFRKIDSIAWDQTCNDGGQEDFIRHIPCPHNKLCIDEDTPEWVIPGFQFTYHVQDTTQPRFWYVSVSSCHHNSTDSKECFWQFDPNQDIVIDYDIWLVNGHPFVKHVNPFEHQFSFELHDIFEVYLAFFALYAFLVPIQLYALSRQKHMLPLILTICMCMEFVGLLFNLVHALKFAFDGMGFELLKVVGNFVDNVAQCFFMLLLLLVVKGWTITRMGLPVRSKAVLFTVWGTYTVASMALFIWNLMEIDLVSDIDEWQTWPGFLILAFRIAIMVWFLLELRKTILLERSSEKHRFYLHFGAGFLVWFVYLPIVAIICTQISPLWRYKTILSVMCAADFLSYCVMVHLLWPSRSYLYFNLKVEMQIPMEEIAGLHDSSCDTSSEESILDVAETAKLVCHSVSAEPHGLRNKRSQSNLKIEEAENAIALQSVPHIPQLKNSSESMLVQLDKTDLCDTFNNDNGPVKAEHLLTANNQTKTNRDNCDSGIESIIGAENNSKHKHLQL